MPKFQDTTTVPHSAKEMFDLVADIESYPEFLPMCEKLVVREKREKGDKTLLVAEMTVGYKMIRETFTTQVVLKPKENAIDVSYINGPFRYLENRWTFIDRGDGYSDVEFFIDYEFKSRTLGMVMGSMFDRAFRMFSNAFRKRAAEVYGNAEARRAQAS